MEVAVKQLEDELNMTLSKADTIFNTGIAMAKAKYDALVSFYTTQKEAMIKNAHITFDKKKAKLTKPVTSSKPRSKMSKIEREIEDAKQRMKTVTDTKPIPDPIVPKLTSVERTEVEKHSALTDLLFGEEEGEQQEQEEEEEIDEAEIQAAKDRLKAQLSTKSAKKEEQYQEPKVTNSVVEVSYADFMHEGSFKPIPLTPAAKPSPMIPTLTQSSLISQKIEVPPPIIKKQVKKIIKREEKDLAPGISTYSSPCLA